jgi:quinol-cytochrome oxidoreductase complex cytochrome b subunit
LGSLLGLVILIQVLSGLLLVLYYTVEDHLAFNSIQYLMMEVNLGWLIRLLHFNLASFFFLVLFLHLLKSLFYFSSRLKLVWFVGLVIFLLIIMEAFLGYALI